MTRREGHGWWPYLLPFFVFLGVQMVASRAPEAAQTVFLPLKVAAPLGLFLYYFACGEYPELRGFGARWRGAPLDLLVGVAGAALWVAPYLLWPSWRPGAEEAFDPGRLGPDLVWLTLELLTPIAGVWALVVALLISGALSLVLLDRQRGKVAVVADGFFSGINERIEASARAEDVDDPVEPEPAGGSGEGEQAPEGQAMDEDEHPGLLEGGDERGPERTP